MTIRIFQNAWFKRFARQENIDKSVLIDAVSRAEKGSVDANLGGGVIKQRIARAGQGKSGGYRTIIVFRRESRAFFVYGFAKSDRKNITRNEKEAFKEAASELLALSEKQI
ncbi:type II toxin-antitoxin system RelE/ParE family toxin [Oscillatoriales cyanobacterium LEGE 11467]|uniref:Type II toxin-antitoxin system RelE/ParE family toxin n=1 Tax=Zarconia navalis LEGE 11467 TaxID=1828826 RepID=A0A928VW27_9CYAN|nr:type II toxin-antitoxin system RelE/ParE family toxin [Zarconia navalis]MBE9040589.1 type II toxin-antitoxin system RelE/ParE family toxin [Zarconia navalis LEGE 11467]